MTVQGMEKVAAVIKKLGYGLNPNCRNPNFITTMAEFCASKDSGEGDPPARAE
jgi:hypothetical protein